MKKWFSVILALVLMCTFIPFSTVNAEDEPVKGDANGDGVVTALDARIVLQFAVSPDRVNAETLRLLDMDNNYRITAMDARYILRMAIDETPGTSSTPHQILALFGYEYDATQNIYYTSMNPWQRYFGFTDLYDDMAVFTNMRYQTLKIDFEYGDLLWRLQWWKGQYGVLEGAELGVYTKEYDNIDSPFYECAEDHNLFEMSFDYYHTVKDFEKMNPLFTRPSQEHWWITGFKFGWCDPTNNVVKATLIARDKTMADGIEEGLLNVTDKNGNPKGFVKYNMFGDMSGYNYYKREETKDGRYMFTVVWKDAGYTNYGIPDNPEA